MRLILIYFPVIFWMTGCIPYHFTEVPGARGTVIDSETNQPIQGVVVELQGPNHIFKDVTITSETQELGMFIFVPKKKWGIYIFPSDVFPIPYRALFSHEQYKDYQVEFSHRPMDKIDTVNLGTIKLDQITKCGSH